MEAAWFPEPTLVENLPRTVMWAMNQFLLCEGIELVGGWYLLQQLAYSNPTHLMVTTYWVLALHWVLCYVYCLTASTQWASGGGDHRYPFYRRGNWVFRWRIWIPKSSCKYYTMTCWLPVWREWQWQLGEAELLWQHQRGVSAYKVGRALIERRKSQVSSARPDGR
jgi:hypothetical protein